MTAFTINFRLDEDSSYKKRYDCLTNFFKSGKFETFNKDTGTSTIHCKTSHFNTSKMLAASLGSELLNNDCKFSNKDFVEIIQYENIKLDDKTKLLFIFSVSYITRGIYAESSSLIDFLLT